MNYRTKQFNEWMRDDPAIRQMGTKTFLTRGVRSAQQLEAEQPDVFDELYEAAEDLLEQAPFQENPSW